MQLNPYLMLNGRCEEAFEFWQQALDGKIEALMRMKDAPPNPEHPMPPGAENKVMHASLRVAGTQIFASDGMPGAPVKFEGFSLSLTLPSDAEAKRRFDALAQGGTVTLPLGKTFFSSAFGMLADKFGVHWMIMSEQR
jgi:PhnB protein